MVKFCKYGLVSLLARQTGAVKVRVDASKSSGAPSDENPVAEDDVFKFKICAVGAGNVGKTCFLIKYCMPDQVFEYRRTILPHTNITKS